MKDKQFMNFFIAILGGLVAFTVVILIIARGLSSVHEEMDLAMVKSINERIKPVGIAYVGDEAMAAEQANQSSQATSPTLASAQAHDPKTIYETVCAACHATGVANAPKYGDKAAWAPRMGDINVLYAAVINGMNAMPPRAGRPDLSDEVLHSAVDYMLDAVR